MTYLRGCGGPSAGRQAKDVEFTFAHPADCGFITR
jgi:hypothetical protein